MEGHWLPLECESAKVDLGSVAKRRLETEASVSDSDSVYDVLGKVPHVSRKSQRKHCLI